MCAFKLSMESQMETLDTGECGNGGYKLFFSLIQHSLLLGKKKKKVDSRQLVSRNREVYQAGKTSFSHSNNNKILLV